MSRRTGRIGRIVALSAAGLALTLGVSGCAPATGATTAVEVTAETIIIDVRTPAEHAGGYLEGAVLLDYNGGQFAAEVPNLDPDAVYLVYCRSGNRAGQAISLMQQAGITAVTNLGSLEEAASATGLPIVR